MSFDYDRKYLVEQAFEAREMAYVPYSSFKVGAALLSEDGRVFGGCNIENASYTPTNCAERTAVFKAVSEGVRKFKAIAVCGGFDGKAEDYCFPCGVCRQVLMEFAHPDEFEILVARSVDDFRVFTLRELLPHGFGPADLDK